MVIPACSLFFVPISYLAEWLKNEAVKLLMKQELGVILVTFFALTQQFFFVHQYRSWRPVR